MPHVSEFRATGDHDRHDQLLVAALAAGDLSGTDRDHALDLTRSCATCADLHDDLVAIARATAAVPPPVSARPRDFQLTPADAARLRPAGWRRLFGSFAGARSLASRPLGVGLATLGLVGLLVGNAPAFSLGSAASIPSGASGGGAGAAEDSTAAQPMASAAAASSAPDYVQAVPGASPAASAGGGGAVSGSALGGASPSAVPRTSRDGSLGPVPAASLTTRGAASSDGQPDRVTSSPAPVAIESTPASPAADTSPFRPLNLLFGLAVIAGLGLLVASRFRSRSTV